MPLQNELDASHQNATPDTTHEQLRPRAEEPCADRVPIGIPTESEIDAWTPAELDAYLRANGYDPEDIRKTAGIIQARFAARWTAKREQHESNVREELRMVHEQWRREASAADASGVAAIPAGAKTPEELEAWLRENHNVNSQYGYYLAGYEEGGNHQHEKSYRLGYKDGWRDGRLPLNNNPRERHESNDELRGITAEDRRRERNAREDERDQMGPHA